MPHVAGVRHSYVDVDGLLMHVAEAGQGEPLVMVHGWPQHWYMWRHLIPELARNHRVICPDLRGFGWTEAPATGYRKEEMAADVVGLLDALGVDRFHLVGHDWGAYVGFVLALQHPERVRGYLALSMTHPWPPLGIPQALGAWRFFYMALLDKPVLSPLLLQRYPALVRAMLSAARPAAWTPEEVAAFVDRTRDPARAAAMSAVYRVFTTREAFPLLRGRYRDVRLQVPTRLVVGRHDPVIRPALLEGFADHADDMEVELIPGGHFIADEQPEAVLAQLRAAFAWRRPRAGKPAATRQGSRRAAKKKRGRPRPAARGSRKVRPG
ncbi:MAG: hypothetical protein QOE92_571 [Chloroflexota bacterium]|nr:hypothetical protein [Chloroflexota bacterium]